MLPPTSLCPAASSSFSPSRSSLSSQPPLRPFFLLVLFSFSLFSLSFLSSTFSSASSLAPCPLLILLLRVSSSSFLLPLLLILLRLLLRHFRLFPRERVSNVSACKARSRGLARPLSLRFVLYRYGFPSPSRRHTRARPALLRCPARSSAYLAP